MIGIVVVDIMFEWKLKELIDDVDLSKQPFFKLIRDINEIKLEKWIYN